MRRRAGQKDLGLLALVVVEHQKGSLLETVHQMVWASLPTDLSEKRVHRKGLVSGSDLMAVRKDWVGMVVVPRTDWRLAVEVLQKDWMV